MTWLLPFLLRTLAELPHPVVVLYGDVEHVSLASDPAVCVLFHAAVALAVKQRGDPKLETVNARIFRYVCQVILQATRNS